jgi:hypothetical protein
MCCGVRVGGVHRIEICGWVGHSISWWRHDLLGSVTVECGVGRIMGGLHGTGLEVVDWGAEALFLSEVNTRSNKAQ